MICSLSPLNFLAFLTITIFVEDYRREENQYYIQVFVRSTEGSPFFTTRIIVPVDSGQSRDIEYLLISKHWFYTPERYGLVMDETVD